MRLTNAAKYFKENQAEVISWWNSESEIGAETFRRGLDRVVSELKNRNIKDVMDVACGKGRATKELAKFFNVAAVDISGAMLKIVYDLNLANVKIVEANLENLPLKDESFDAIVFLAATVHLDNPTQVFNEFYRVLRPHGLLILDIDNKFGAIRLLKNFLNQIFWLFDKSYKVERLKRQQIFQTLSDRKISRLLNRAGFKIIHKFYIGFLMPFRLKDRLILSPKTFSYFKQIALFCEKAPAIRSFSTYIYFVCEK